MPSTPRRSMWCPLGAHSWRLTVRLRQGCPSGASHWSWGAIAMPLTVDLENVAIPPSTLRRMWRPRSYADVQAGVGVVAEDSQLDFKRAYSTPEETAKDIAAMTIEG